MSYTTAVPYIIGNPRFEEYYPEFLQRCKTAGVKRIFLCPSMAVADEATKQREIALLKKYVPLFKAEGFEVGSWCSSLGHGGTCDVNLQAGSAHAELTLMRSLDGNQDNEDFCPLDENFRALFCDWVRRLASTGVDIIQLDDDHRIGFRRGERFCCCDKHTALLEAELGEPFDPARMKKALSEGGPNKWRDAWLKVQGYGLQSLAAALRTAVDEVNPAVRLTACSCLSVWDIDGVDSLTLAKTFAGNTKPLLRLIGAPYWAALRNYAEAGLGVICEYERMQQQWAADSGVEIFGEGDVYPRPRYSVPAAYLEGFDQVMRAAGTTDGILKYMFDYTASPTYETGYYDRHLRDLPVFEKIHAMFDGKKAAGVTVFEPMHTVALSHEPGNWEGRCIPASLRFVTDNSLPVRHDAGEDATVIFGDAAECAGEEQLAHGAILDAAAARILTRRGFDVGLADAEETITPAGEEYFAEKEYVAAIGGSYRVLKTAPGAEVLSLLHAGDKTAPGAYRYTNAAGRKFLVYAFVARDSLQTGAISGIMRGWCRAAQLRSQLAWLAGRTPDAICDAAPDLYMLVKKDADSLTVGLWNFGVDTVFAPVVHLGADWAALEPGAGSAALEGRTVTLGELPAFGFASFTLHK